MVVTTPPRSEPPCAPRPSLFDPHRRKLHDTCDPSSPTGSREPSRSPNDGLALPLSSGGSFSSPLPSHAPSPQLVPPSPTRPQDRLSGTVSTPHSPNDD